MEEQEFSKTSFDKALLYVDKVLPLLPDFSHFNLSETVMNSDWTEQEKDEAYNLDMYMQILLIERLKYVDGNVNAYWADLNEIGRQVKSAGGHFAYLKKFADKVSADVERQKLNDEKLRYDVKNSKRIFKTYWWTFWFAVIAFVISLVLGVLKLLEAFQPPHTQ